MVREQCINTTPPLLTQSSTAESRRSEDDFSEGAPSTKRRSTGSEQDIVRNKTIQEWEERYTLIKGQADLENEYLTERADRVKLVSEKHAGYDKTRVQLS